MSRIAIRPLRQTEVAELARYFACASLEDTERMGLEPGRIPAASALAQIYSEHVAAAPDVAKEVYNAWLVDDEVVGHAALKDFTIGGHGSIHLHMWKPTARGQGFGQRLFCLSALDFYERFRLSSLICEPRSANPMPNRMLTKVGFPLVKTYSGASSAIATVCELNRYAITKDIVQTFLALR